MDDGPQTIEQSVEMLQLAAENGTTDIVASPHSNNEFPFQPDVIAEKIEDLAGAIKGAVRIHTGCDFHLSYDNIQDSLTHPSKYAINHKRYVLVEFSDLLIPKTTDDVFYQMRSVGMIPIITHPERNMLLRKHPQKLKAWVESGCLLQVTAQSFLGRFGKQAKSFSDQLLRDGLVHVVASDAHDARHRPPLLAEAYRYVAKSCGEYRAQRLFVGNPGAALTGAALESDLEPAPAQSKKWYQF